MKCKRHQKRDALLRLIVMSQTFSKSQGWGTLSLKSRISATTASSAFFDWNRNRLTSPRHLQHTLRRIVPFRSFNRDDSDFTLLKSENLILRDTIRQLEEENQRLKQRAQRVIGLENFEGERFFRGEMDSSFIDTGGITLTGEEIIQDELWCDELDGGEHIIAECHSLVDCPALIGLTNPADPSLFLVPFVNLLIDQCPVEPTISFSEALRDRALWLVGLLLMQSFSGIILSRNEALLADHPVIIFFLTMLVGAGGNAGNQASVRGML